MAVIILSDEDDIHAQAVAREVFIAFGQKAVILDSSRFPRQWELSLSVGNAKKPYFDIFNNDSRLEADQISGVWWRRPARHVIPQGVTDLKVRQFCLDESRSTFQGWLYTLGKRVINPLMSELSAHQKPYQLVKAHDAGMYVPSTLITNSSKEALSFYDKHNGNIVFKALTGTSWQMTETRVLGREYLKDLNRLMYAPAIFQKYIKGGIDIRLNVIEEKIHAIEILPQHDGARVDWRIDLSAKICEHSIPEDFQVKVLKLHKGLGLRFGAYDFKLLDGVYYFLEVNPQGQFLFAEIHAGHNLAYELAKALVEGPSDPVLS